MKPNLFVAVILLLSACPAFAQSTQPTIALSTTVEEGKKMVHGLVTLNGKPIENVGLQYYVQRTFGNLLIGQDKTLDDGTSAVAFPTDLPGAPDGKLHLIVRIKEPPEYTSTFLSVAFPADVQSAPPADAFPRALWAPNAPLPLMLSIFAVLAGVWLSYFFVISRIVAIRTGGKQ